MKCYSAGIAAAAFLLAGAALAEVPQVATDIAPVHGLAARVMQGVGEPALILPPGASPHGYALRPSEALALERADAVFWIGEALAPWLAGPIGELAADARVVELLEADGTLQLPFRQQALFEEHGHEAEHHDMHGAAHQDVHDDSHAGAHTGMGEELHGHEHGGLDPHAWLAPENGKLWLDLIAAELSALDPENAAAYAANAEAGKAEIDAAAEEVSTLAAPLRASGFIVFHDAYQYFEYSFGLKAAGAISLGDASDPGPARLTAIREAVAEEGIACVFSEPQFNPGLVKTVLEGSGAKSVVLDPAGAAIEPGPGFYPALLRQMGQAMASCS
ncbi:zinc ABC transporter substrate-binding protein (plasmid) [Roseobacteraceae bacterium NS-SX3]